MTTAGGSVPGTPGPVVTAGAPARGTTRAAAIPGASVPGTLEAVPIPGASAPRTIEAAASTGASVTTAIDLVATTDRSVRRAAPGVLSRSHRMPAERKRPWYLVVALLGALALGTTGAYAGWNAAALYFVSVDPTTAGEGIADPHDRELVVSRAEAELHVLDAEKSRGWPIAVATLLLGSATLLFAMRALGGSAGARSVLVQLVLAQAAVGVASHFLLRDVFEADLRWLEAKESAEEHASGVGHEQSPLPSASVLRAASSMILVLRTLGSLLVVVGLTQRKSRAYFDETAAAAPER